MQGMRRTTSVVRVSHGLPQDNTEITCDLRERVAAVLKVFSSTCTRFVLTIFKAPRASRNAMLLRPLKAVTVLGQRGGSRKTKASFGADSETLTPLLPLAEDPHSVRCRTGRESKQAFMPVPGSRKPTLPSFERPSLDRCAARSSRLKEHSKGISVGSNIETVPTRARGSLSLDAAHAEAVSVLTRPGRFPIYEPHGDVMVEHWGFDEVTPSPWPLLHLTAQCGPQCAWGARGF